MRTYKSAPGALFCYGDVVLDPFIGLGTTLTASLLSSRVCYGFELDAGLFDHLRTLYSSFDAIGYVDRFVRGRYSRHKTWFLEPLFPLLSNLT